MASENEEGGGFGWGFFVGGLIGFVAGAYLASGPGREHVDSIRSRTIELTSSGDKDPEPPLGKAVREGVAAARRRRSELESTPAGVDITENGKSE